VLVHTPIRVASHWFRFSFASVIFDLLVAVTTILPSSEPLYDKTTYSSLR
jgi:hypothetical protein